jgi:hypothetical protein
VVQLARENSFDVFVQGSSLFFQPSTSSGTAPVHIAFRDVKAIRFEKTLTIPSGVQARVQSWNSQNMTSYDNNSVGAGSNATQNSSSTTTPSTVGDQPFLFSGSNFTSKQVSDSAGRYATELSRLGILLHIEMPWDLTLSPRTEISIDETASMFDTTYIIDSVERHYSTTTGSSQIIRAIMV